MARRIWLNIHLMLLLVRIHVAPSQLPHRQVSARNVVATKVGLTIGAPRIKALAPSASPDDSPNAIITNKEREMIRYASLAKAGIWPAEGGALDQTDCEAAYTPK